MRSPVIVGVVILAALVLLVVGTIIIWNSFIALRGGAVGADVSSLGLAEISEDGSYLVGHDIVMGTYRSDDPQRGCAWSLYSGGIAVASGETEERQVVTIGPTHTIFQTIRCGTWRLIEERPGRE